MHVVAPANATQAPTSGEIPIDVRVDADLDPASLRVRVITGWPDPTASTELTSRLTFDAHGATAALHAADLTPGLVTIKARAERRHGDEHESGYASVSWEPGVDLATADRCDPIATRKCLMPFPNDFFTVADGTSATGRRVHFRAASMPTNSIGVPIDPTEWNRNDGFSPGAMILTYVPGLDLARTGAAPITDIGASLRPDQPIVLIDAATGAALADLDRARQPGRSDGRAGAGRAGGARTCPRGTGSSSRCATSATTPARRSPPNAGSRSTATAFPTFTPAIEGTAGALRVALLDPRARGHRARAT